MTAGSAAFFGFLSYVLEILVDIWENTGHVRMAYAVDEHRGEVGNHAYQGASSSGLRSG